MINNDKIFSCESFNIDDRLKRLAERRYDPETGTTGDSELDRFIDNEKSEEGIIEVLHQHGKKISTNKELEDQVINLKNKYNEKLVKNKYEFDKLGGFSGLSFRELMKSIGPSGAKFIELENVLLYKTTEHGSFNFSNVFCFIKTGEKYKKQDKNRKKPTMKTLNVACIVKKGK